MNSNHSRQAGQPLAVFAAVLLLWIGARSVLWQSPFPLIAEGLVDSGPLASIERRPSEGIQSLMGRGAARLGFDQKYPKYAVPKRASIAGFPSPISVADSFEAVIDDQRLPHPMILENPRPSAELERFSMLEKGLGDQATETINRIAPSESQTSYQAATTPWSFDSWLFLRSGSRASTSTGPLPSTYGASQAGAVLRYNLDQQNPRNPSVYVRATKALAGPSQGEVAAGLSARPFKRVPMIALAEARVSRSGPQTELRPAVLLVTELPPANLPFDFDGRAYAQAGYVGGNFATGFADGQARIDREMIDFDLAKIRVGAGIWGGAQKGAARLDIGPSASASVTVAGTPIRLAIDYRHRIGGDAVPQSGAALTISTGF